MKYILVTFCILLTEYCNFDFDKTSLIDIELSMESISNNNHEIVSRDVQKQSLTYSEIKSLVMNKSRIAGLEISSYNYNSSYLGIYYDNLNSYMPYNQKGSCGYVALGMLLSYYDTYWNDETIYYENFDRFTSLSSFLELNNAIHESPGVHYKWVSDTTIGDTNSSIPTGEEFSTGNPIYDSNYIYYYNLVYHSSDDFQAYLISSYGEPLEYIDLNDETAFSMTILELKALFEEYLEYEDLSNIYDFVYYDRTTKSSQQLRNLIISYVQAGYPVAVAMNLITSENSDFSNPSSGSHVLVAYKYENNIIYGHNGYMGAANSPINIENFAQYTDFPTIERYHMLNEYYSIYILIPKSGTHICSDNYKINGNVYCPCEFI